MTNMATMRNLVFISDKFNVVSLRVHTSRNYALNCIIIDLVFILASQYGGKHFEAQQASYVLPGASCLG